VEREPVNQPTIENDEDESEAAEPAKPREPIFPTGRPLTVAPDAVQLTFLDPASLPEFSPDDPEAPERAGIELRTPLGVKLPVFDGPLDLLLHLIRRDELDIYDIPIGHITEQYLGMLGLLQVLDLEVAGDFLVMAATLMRIKARMLLPTWPDDEDEDDPRLELVEQLLEYRRFKEVAHNLKDREENRRLQFQRGWTPEFEDDEPAELAPLSYGVLIDVMKDVLSRVGEEFFYEVELEDVTLEEKIDLVMETLREGGRVLFVDLVSRTPRRLHVVVTFMAILELSRLGRIRVAQESVFGQIWVYPGSEEGAAVPEGPPAVEGEGDHHGTA
jgi:segregation and condensation protein A